jgi:hypothetical protein
MAHFAQLDDNNVVLQVIVVSDEHEPNGEQWCHDFAGGRWKQTSYNARIRKNFAGIGFTYDEQRDAFIPLKQFPSWILDEETCQWVAPNPKPSTEYQYRWSELLGQWVTTNRWLFENYGLTQDASLIAPTVEKYGLENRKMVQVINKPEYVLQLEKANNILFVHAQVPEWTAEIKTMYQSDIDALHKEIGTEIYAYHGLGNVELEDKALQLIKFAELFGFYQHENVVLGDGLEHFILKREVPSA